ncbi:rhomboid family intramembrane serine protease [Pedobacter sp. MC2016-05]|jgi:membrane associated rhomboid family serine protease|uniref:rhomboid family intramembrane serine protease n=1 Tax=unclassified Pedobacter TaxID=2628915 RepID=UPI0007036377|nr:MULTISPECIES: rhomboid family intramembrane serine protease [unclassified Pedobacter]KQN37266.1 peptidase [Pedobacter sp. Leaf41]MCX2475412.1 rhomboid family intramembrane serine protease [Pedobacter sp. MC2016-05]RZL27792.1 MAG: rhomboid family intramembrane serine protease [Pedobacter sp.]
MEYLSIAPVASIIFVFTIVTSLYAFYDQSIYGKFMLHPYSVSKGKNVYTLITSGLIHADWMHLFFNMFTFYAFAFTLEQMMGSWQFGLMYFLALILSDLPTVFRHKNDFHYNSLGASGAISGVLFSFILFNPMAGIGILFLPFSIPAVIFGGIYLAYCAYASKNSRDNINHDAHFFGALTGLIFTIIFVPGILQNFFAIIGAKLGM